MFVGVVFFFSLSGVLVRKSAVRCPHGAPAIAQLKSVFFWGVGGDKWDVNTHLHADTHSHLLNLKKTLRAYMLSSVCVCVCGVLWVGVWVGVGVCSGGFLGGGILGYTCFRRERLYPSATLKSLNRITWDKAAMSGRWVCVYVCASALTIPEVCSTSWWPQETPADHCSSNPWETGSQTAVMIK